MKKKIFTAALAAVLILAGCSNGNKPAETTTAATEATTTTTAAPAATTAAPAATTTTAAATTAAAQTEDNSGKKMLLSTFDGHGIYREDCTLNDFGQFSAPYAYARLSTGMYFDSDTNPELFTPDEFEYSGSYAETGPLVRLEAGSEFGNIKIASAATTIMAPWDEAVQDFNPDAENGFEVMTADVTIDGDITLTGMARLYYDEFYTVASGDIVFVPDSSYTGLPLMIDISGNFDTNNGTLNFDEKGGTEEDGGFFDPTYGGGLCVYSDAPIFRIGNLNQNYSDRPEIFEFFNGGSANCTKKVEITLTNVTLGWNNNFGASFACTGVIKDIKAIG